MKGKGIGMGSVKGGKGMQERLWGMGGDGRGGQVTKGNGYEGK